MPLHVHPHLRALEEAEESEGLIQSLNSVAVTAILAAEAAPTRTKVVPVQFRVIRGTKYVPS